MKINNNTLKNITKIILLLFSIICILSLILNLNEHQLKRDFLYDKTNIFINNYFFSCPALFVFYAVIIEDLIRKSNIISIKTVFQCSLISIGVCLFVENYSYYSTIFYIINIIVLLWFYKKAYLLIIVIPLMILMSFSQNYYVNYLNKEMYEKCNAMIIKEEDIKECIESFSLYREDFTIYLTNVNIRLAKKNKGFKKRLEEKIIIQNKDETCKINKNFELGYRKDNVPCIR